jgi:hypothetical protein
MTGRRSSYDALPTWHTTLSTGHARVLVFCNSSRHQGNALFREAVHQDGC